MVLEWKWNVKTGTAHIYNHIYEEAKKKCTEKRMTPKMMYIEAVEHYRRYDEKVGLGFRV